MRWDKLAFAAERRVFGTLLGFRSVVEGDKESERIGLILVLVYSTS